MAKSHNYAHKKALRPKEEIIKDIQQRLYRLGELHARIHIMHKEKHDLLLQLERLDKEQGQPEAPKQEIQPVVPEIVEEVSHGEKEG